VTRLAHISDLHFGAIEPGALGALRKAIQGAAPAAVVVSGDLTMRGRAREFDEARAFLRGLGPPVIAIPGNHDVPHWNLPLRFGAPLRRYARAVEGVASDELRVGPVQLMAVNTARSWAAHWNWSHGAFSRDQVVRVDAGFADLSPGDWRGLVAHHPFEVPADLRGFRVVRRAESMLAVLARRRIDFVLTGHLHRTSWAFSAHAERAFGRSVLLIQASTATSSRRRDQPNAFNVIDLSPEGLLLTPWALRDGGFQEGASLLFRRSERGLALDSGDKLTGG
jgi:3',5'-cyclic AMP phosphodiesterase CpdA